MERNYQNKVTDIQNNHKEYYEAFERLGPFGGPSLYFHTRALDVREKAFEENFSDEYKKHFLEMVYATLVSWGMHRMGESGAGMVNFSKFIESINWDDIKKVANDSTQNLDCIYNSIKIMDGKTHLVGNSKVMAHLFPKIVAPIDRQYTLSYLCDGNTGIPINRDGKSYNQLDCFKGITENFYHKVFEGEAGEALKKFCGGLVEENNGGWNTSELKVIDNLIIGRMKKYRLIEETERALGSERNISANRLDKLKSSLKKLKEKKGIKEIKDKPILKTIENLLQKMDSKKSA